MPSIYLVANEVLFTSYGHIQWVYDPDDSFDNGDEKELEVQPSFLATGNWDVSPEQDLDIPFAADTVSFQLDIDPARSVSDVWSLLVNTRNFFAGLTIDYRLGLTGSLEGQNSNTYITTLAHITGLDISAALSAILAAPDISSLPGIARNVLFDHHADDGTPLAPVALTLTGTDGNDVISGGNSADHLSAGAGNDSLRGYGANDTLNGGAGRDALIGDTGDDTLDGGAGKDTLDGGADNDTLHGRGGRDLLRGDAGDDILNGNASHDRIHGGTGDDMANGGSGSDQIYGNQGDDILRGGRDADTLRGGGGNDTLLGQQGDDLLSGMKGHDTLTGGFGADTFLFNGAVNEGKDDITDFQTGTDIIRVLGLGFGDVSITGGATALITLGGLTEITLTGVAAADIGAADFDFLIA